MSRASQQLDALERRRRNQILSSVVFCIAAFVTSLAFLVRSVSEREQIVSGVVVSNHFLGSGGRGGGGATYSCEVRLVGGLLVIVPCYSGTAVGLGVQLAVEQPIFGSGARYRLYFGIREAQQSIQPDGPASGGSAG